jgi:hypothetical protein
VWIRENEKGGNGNSSILLPTRDQLHEHGASGWVAKFPNGSVRIRLPLLAKFSFWKFEAVHALIVPLQCLEADQIGYTRGRSSFIMSKAGAPLPLRMRRNSQPRGIQHPQADLNTDLPSNLIRRLD